MIVSNEKDAWDWHNNDKHCFFASDYLLNTCQFYILAERIVIFPGPVPFGLFVKMYLLFILWMCWKVSVFRAWLLLLSAEKNHVI